MQSGPEAPPKEEAKVKNKGGRPVVWTEEKLEELADLMEEHMDKCQREKRPFWWKDFAFEVNLLPSRIAQYSKLNDKLMSAYMKGLALQEWQVSKGALYKKFSSNFAQFFLSNMHAENWRVRTEVDVSELTNQQYESLMKQINDLQSSERNIAEMSTSNETMS